MKQFKVTTKVNRQYQLDGGNRALFGMTITDKVHADNEHDALIAAMRRRYNKPALKEKYFDRTVAYVVPVRDHSRPVHFHTSAWWWRKPGATRAILKINFKAL